MTEADPDGTVRLRCYLPSADTVWFSAGCDGLAGCGHVAPIGIRPAVDCAVPSEAAIVVVGVLGLDYATDEAVAPERRGKA